ncbi:hypothetical protein V6S67_02780 [Arthrobacter sp. Soc17.1.1.1]|uniref:PGAP1-like alpha/beta domain-containing protein n=1 Tax=Arthrobacter sp. Soc17.1.1.1 TaxID=3121277 RepID=UPI002FE4DE53
MTGLIGMDPGQVRDLARLLDVSSRSLDDMASLVGTAIRGTSWGGADAEQFRHAWFGRHAPVLRQVGIALHETSRTALADADQQEDASALTTAGAGRSGIPSVDEDPGNPFSDLWGDAVDGVDSAIDTIGDGVTRIGDWAGDGLDWGVDRLTDTGEFIIAGGMEVPEEIAGSLPDVTEDLLHFGGLFLGTEPPSVTEVVAGGALLAGSAGNLAYRVGTVGKADPHILDDGEAEVGDAIPLPDASRGVAVDGKDDDFAPVVMPSSLSAIANSTVRAYGDADVDGAENGAVRITTVNGPDGPSFIVSIPGTQTWAPTGDIPADLTGNLEVASGQSSTASEAVRLAMMEAGIPSGAPVLLSGHSQGGMIAMELAGDPAFRDQFAVTNVLTFGSPVDITAVPGDIDIVAFQHASDVVPRLDLGGLSVDKTFHERPNNADVITLPNPDGTPWYDAMGNHDPDRYVTSISAAESAGGPADSYGDQSFGRFLSSDPSDVSGVVVPVRRSH